MNWELYIAAGTQSFVTLLVGLGVWRELWKLRSELSFIKGQYSEFRKSVDDRITKLEGRHD